MPDRDTVAVRSPAFGIPLPHRASKLAILEPESAREIRYTVQGFIQELKRRNVFRVGVAYLALAWLVIQVTDMAVPALHLPESLNSIVFYIGVVGFPFALFLAWAFELTPEGIKAESEVSPEESIAPATGQRLKLFTIVVLALALVFVIVDQYILEERGDSSLPVEAQATDDQAVDSATNEAQPSIAVLPFENFSGKEEDEYFSDGLSDTVLHQLAQVPDLKVIARNSTFQFKGTNLDVREIGERLGVSSLLEGSVQRYGNKVRVIAQLVRTTDGTHIWSESFDYDMDDIFALHDAIASAVVMQLKRSLLPGGKPSMTQGGTNNPAAYDLYLRAQAEHETLFSPSLAENTESIDDYPPVVKLTQALQLDANYVDAMISLVEIYNHFAFQSTSMARYGEYLKKAEPMLERIMKLAPAYAAAWDAKGSIEHRSGNRSAAIASFSKAIELNPNRADAHLGLAIASGHKDPEITLKHMRIFQELDPEETFERPIIIALVDLGRVDEALDRLEKGLEDKDYTEMELDDLASINFWVRGLPSEAARWGAELLRFAPRNTRGPITLARAWLAAEDLERAEYWLQVATDTKADSDLIEMYQGRLHMIRGDYAAAKAIFASMQDATGLTDTSSSLWQSRLCILQDDLTCARRSLAELDSAVALQHSRGRIVTDWQTIQYLLAAEIKARAGEAPGTSAQQSLDLSRTLERTSWNFGRDYLDVESLVLLNRSEEAVEVLGETLLEDGGFIPWESFALPADEGVILSRLAETPGFAEWQAEFRKRRNEARAAMKELESSGIIPSPPGQGG